MKNISLLGITVTDAPIDEVLEYMASRRDKKYYMTTPNPEMVVFASRHKWFRDILNNAQVAFGDGIGLQWAASLLGRPFKNRSTGTDFVKIFCEKNAEKPVVVGFLGARGKIALRAAECLRLQYPGLKVAFAEAANPDADAVVLVQKRVAEYLHKNSDAMGLVDGSKTAKNAIAATSAKKGKNGAVMQYDVVSQPQIDMLFVAFGFPKQEKWIAENLEKLPVRVAIGIGGAFDYLSGAVPRAPHWIRSLGFEWLFRLLMQPWRIKRQLALFEFVWLVCKAKMMGKEA